MNLPVGAGSQFDSLSAPGEVVTGHKPDLCEARNFWSIYRQRVQGNASARAVEALPWMLSKAF